jgi:hypothetical protein
MERIWVWLVLVAGIYVNLFGLWLHRTLSEVTKWPALQRWVAQFEFSPETLGGFSYSRLALISLFTDRSRTGAASDSRSNQN